MLREGCLQDLTCPRQPGANPGVFRMKVHCSRPDLKNQKNKKSVWTLADCEWRAAAPGLKPLRLPHATYYAWKQLLDFFACPLLLALLLQGLLTVSQRRTPAARSFVLCGRNSDSNLKRIIWDNFLSAPILLLPAPAYGEPSLEKFSSAAPILLPSLRSSQVLGGQSFEKFTSLKLTGAVARDHILLAGDPGRVVTVGRVRCLFNKYNRQIHT